MVMFDFIVKNVTEVKKNLFKKNMAFNKTYNQIKLFGLEDISQFIDKRESWIKFKKLQI